MSHDHQLVLERAWLGSCALFRLPAVNPSVVVVDRRNDDVLAIEAEVRAARVV
jgi:hypothetical protein